MSALKYYFPNRKAFLKWKVVVDFNKFVKNRKFVNEFCITGLIFRFV